MLQCSCLDAGWQVSELPASIAMCVGNGEERVTLDRWFITQCALPLSAPQR
jgi:hypothetical protein